MEGFFAAANTGHAPNLRLETYALLLLEVDLLVGVLGNAGADLGRRFACFRHGVGVERLLRTGGALGAVIGLVTAAQASVAKRAVAAAVAGELVDHGSNLDSLLIDVHLPRILEMLAGQFGAGKDGRQCGDLERRRGVVRRNVFRGVRPLSIAGSGDSEHGDAQEQAAIG